jgi:hypothetical protein
MYTEPQRTVRRDRPLTQFEVTGDFVKTSISSKVLAFAEDTHRRRRISCIAGPPGIGKTEALLAFRHSHPEEVVITKIAQPNARPGLCMRLVAEAIRDSIPYERPYFMPSGHYEVRNHIFNMLCDRDGFSVRAGHDRQYRAEQFTPLTVIIDEAQNLSREFVDQIRFWSDRDSRYAPFPIGFFLVGNSDLILRPDGRGHPQVSRAIGDRLLHSRTFSYADVLDDDLLLFADSRADLSEDVRAEIVREYGAKGAVRSLRTLSDALDEAREDSNDGEITVDILGEVFAGQRRAGKR